MSKATTAERALNRKGGTMSRLIKTLFGFYPVLLPLVVAGVVLCAIINSIGATFLQSALQIISDSWQSGDWTTAQPKILKLVTTLACIYGVGILSSLFWNRAMAIVTQGSLEKLREKMFNRMQDLPIRYFDTHQRGDIMSHYTNDIDTLRQMISQSLPNLLMTTIVIVTVFFIMLYYSVWMCLVIVAGVAFMTFMTKLLGSNSARFFIAQQTELGVVEGHIEEVMNGQKVVKAFCHESAAEADFDERNEKLFEVSQKANMYANILMPILMNLGNLLYVLVALAGGIFLALGVPNLSISGMALSIAVVVPFLNMTKQFCGQIGQISQQINAVVMGLAGADRIFELIDEEPEADEGYVTLVNAQVNPDTWQLEEADHHTPLLRLVGGVVQKRGVSGELLDARKPIGCRVETRLHEAQRRRRELQHLTRPRHAFGLELLEGNDLVDQTHLERLGGGVLAAEIPNLARLLLAHDVCQVPRAIASIEAADLGTRLAKLGGFGRDGQIA